jgi:hypothetical protein
MQIAQALLKYFSPVRLASRLGQNRPARVCVPARAVPAGFAAQLFVSVQVAITYVRVALS